MVSEPDWCPQDVWDSATATLHPAMTHQVPIDRSPLLMAQRIGIARAILAERERCATLARDFSEYYHGPEEEFLDGLYNTVRGNV